MGKYTPITDCLKSQSGDSVVLTFSKIEEIIAPEKLPPSARRKQNTGLFNLRSWDNVYGSAIANAILDADFQTVMVDMENEEVKLRRIQGV